MTRALAIVFLAATLSCSSDGDKLKVTAPALAIKHAAIFCDVPQSQMIWLNEVIEASIDDPALAGPIYAFHSDGQGVFMHQPWVMSCMGCILYDCGGNRLDPQQVDMTILSAGFQNLTTIYSPELN